MVAVSLDEELKKPEYRIGLAVLDKKGHKSRPRSAYSPLAGPCQGADEAYRFAEGRADYSRLRKLGISPYSHLMRLLSPGIAAKAARPASDPPPFGYASRQVSSPLDMLPEVTLPHEQLIRDQLDSDSQKLQRQEISHRMKDYTGQEAQSMEELGLYSGSKASSKPNKGSRSGLCGVSSQFRSYWRMLGSYARMQTEKIQDSIADYTSPMRLTPAYAQARAGSNRMYKRF